ncbi:hypothetical protein [Opitutus sp. GAS368]|jgi:hypothetical protein|uniref:hypothetical protein n=1 Tax=Opitutus sp. GAS368 TaxID=1882749 RepID=UPI0008798A4A|nr:hypothetical protein [Opitutus sp. GAS368]SDS62245.1 Glucosyl transferase GtrII [Opitutus sp. GAS368]
MIRTRICLYALILAPLAVYWQTVFEDFGFRDDYSYLREAREEPGKIVKVAASHGRPLYGALLETSFILTDEVARLPLLRMITVLLLAVLALALWRQLYQSGWTEVEAAGIGLGVALLPAAQVAAGWAISWPQVLALVLSVAGFSAIETELERGGLKRFVALVGGCFIYALATLIYQSNALFAIVPIAAVLLVRGTRETTSDGKWLAYHLTALTVGIAFSYFLMRGLFESGVFRESVRMQVENNPLTKLAWFFQYPLANALGLYALRDDFGQGAWIFWLTVAGVVAFIAAGVRLSLRQPNPQTKRKWLWCLVILPFFAHAVSLAAAERSIAYRTIFALSGLVVVLMVYSLRAMANAATGKPLLRYAGLALLAAAVAFMANRNAYQLLAEPQSNEWEIARGSLLRVNFTKPTKVFVITPSIEDRSTTRVYFDEFGSLSSSSDWAPKEMVAAAMHERFPIRLPTGGSYTLASGREAPAAKDYDLVIDLRKLKERRER